MTDKNSTLDISAVLNRIGECLKTKKDTEIASALGVSRQTVSGWRRRGSIPYENLIPFAREKNLPLTFILWGDTPLADSQHIGDKAVGVSAVNAELISYISERLNAEMPITDSFSSDYDLFYPCRVYNEIIDRIGMDQDLSPAVFELADKICDSTIEFYKHTVGTVIFGDEDGGITIKEGGTTTKMDAEGRRTVSQNFNAEVGQAAAGDIHNHGEKNK